jgi:hypothetical protein
MPDTATTTTLPLQGKTLKSITCGRSRKAGYVDVVVLETTDGEKWVMFHAQDCCEDVILAEVIGSVDDLIGAPLLLAEERSSGSQYGSGVGVPTPLKDRLCTKDEEDYGSHTWTFYEFRTYKGAVTFRWYGLSNGYYSEKVEVALAGSYYPHDHLDRFIPCGWEEVEP